MLSPANERRPLASIKLDPKNARKHPERQIDDIVDSINRFGFVEQLVIRPNGQLIGGEGRVLALRKIGTFDEVDCRVVAGLTEPQYRALGLALNRVPEGSNFDDRLLKEALDSILEEGEGLEGLGFTDKDIEKLGKDDDGAIAVKEIETTTVDDEFWISVRGPLVHQAAMLHALQAASKGMDGVSVDLGTIAVG